MEENGVLEKMQYVVFRLDNEEYGADINRVTTIEKLMSITRVPKTQECIKGVINMRGEIIPVISLRNKFGMPEAEEDDDIRIIIFKLGEINVGVIVDSVSEVMNLDESQIESLNSITADRNLEYITGIGKTDTQLITLLNLEKLVSEIIGEDK